MASVELTTRDFGLTRLESREELDALMGSDVVNINIEDYVGHAVVLGPSEGTIIFLGRRKDNGRMVLSSPISLRELTLGTQGIVRKSVSLAREFREYGAEDALYHHYNRELSNLRL